MINNVRNVAKVIAQFRQAKKRHAKGMNRGLKKAGAFLIAKSLEIVPVDTGNLKASWFVRAEGEGFTTVVYVGYTAEYAIFVHEDLELRHGADFNAWYWEDIQAGREHERGPNQQAKFLEQPLRQNRRQLAKIVKTEMEVA